MSGKMCSASRKTMSLSLFRCVREDRAAARILLLLCRRAQRVRRRQVVAEWSSRRRCRTASGFGRGSAEVVRVVRRPVRESAPGAAGDLLDDGRYLWRRFCSRQPSGQDGLDADRGHGLARFRVGATIPGLDPPARDRCRGRPAPPRPEELTARRFIAALGATPYSHHRYRAWRRSAHSAHPGRGEPFGVRGDRRGLDPLDSG